MPRVAHGDQPDRVQVPFLFGDKGRGRQAAQRGEQHAQRQSHPKVPTGEGHRERQDTNNDARLQQGGRTPPLDQQEGVGLRHQQRRGQEDAGENAKRRGRQLREGRIGPEKRSHPFGECQKKNGRAERQPQREPQNEGNEPPHGIPVLLAGQDAAQPRDGTARGGEHQHTDHQQLHANAQGEHAVGPQRAQDQGIEAQIEDNHRNARHRGGGAPRQDFPEMLPDAGPSGPAQAIRARLPQQVRDHHQEAEDRRGGSARRRAPDAHAQHPHKENVQGKVQDPEDADKPGHQPRPAADLDELAARTGEKGEETSHKCKRKIRLQHGLQTRILRDEAGNRPRINGQQGREDAADKQRRSQAHREYPVHPAIILIPESRRNQERRPHQENGARKHEDIHQRQGQDNHRHGVRPDELPRHHTVYGTVELDDNPGKNRRRQVMPQRMANDMGIPDRLHLTWLVSSVTKFLGA